MIGRKEFDRAFMLYIAKNLNDYVDDNIVNESKIQESYRIEIEQIYIKEEITYAQKMTWTCPKSILKLRNLRRALNYGTRRGKKI